MARIRQDETRPHFGGNGLAARQIDTVLLKERDAIALPH
jgi:hypothetical protein